MSRARSSTASHTATELPSGLRPLSSPRHPASLTLSTLVARVGDVSAGESTGTPASSAALRVQDRHGAGSARDALLVAAREELVAHGAGGVSLRAVARRAGVSHAAPTHHFGDRAGLLIPGLRRGPVRPGRGWWRCRGSSGAHRHSAGSSDPHSPAITPVHRGLSTRRPSATLRKGRPPACAVGTPSRPLLSQGSPCVAADRPARCRWWPVPRPSGRPARRRRGVRRDATGRPGASPL